MAGHLSDISSVPASHRIIKFSRKKPRKDFVHLFGDDLMSDFTMIVGDERIKAHRLVLMIGFAFSANHGEIDFNAFFFSFLRDSRKSGIQENVQKHIC